MFISDSENEMKKELDVYDWIAENLQKYIQSSSQNKFKNHNRYLRSAFDRRIRPTPVTIEAAVGRRSTAVPRRVDRRWWRGLRWPELPGRARLNVFDVSNKVAENLKDLDIALGHFGHSLSRL